MSRNLSLKKVVPYLRSYSVTKSDQTIPSSFAKHFVHKKTTDSEQDDSEAQQNDDGNFTDTKSSEDRNRPEIFKLIENPDFRELLELSSGKKERMIKRLILKLRKERGISDHLPISYKHALKLNKNEIYRQSIEWYFNHKNSSILISL